MIQTMSGPNDWIQFYHQKFPTTTSLPDSTTVTTTTTTIIPATVSTAMPIGPPLEMPNSSSPSSTHLRPEGRVSKPTRRRSRASRRTDPTTLLNTDTTNFRAMVQQFTGGPSAPFAPTSSPALDLPDLMGFGFGSRPVPHVNRTTLMVSPPGYHLQHQQQQNLYQLENQQQLMYSGTTKGGDNMIFQRVSNPRPPNNVVADHDGILMDHEHGGGGFFPSTSSS